LNTKFSKFGAIFAFLVFTGVIRCHASFAQEVVAVLSSNATPYQEALAGFKESFGRPVEVLSLSNGDIHLTQSERIIVTFGGKAALYPYPAGTTLIYCLAPGLLVRPDQHDGPRSKIRVDAMPDALISNLKDIQPGLKRLAMFWISPFFNETFKDLQRVSQTFGIEIRGVHLESIDELPDSLRAISGHTDALFLTPDPSLITPSVFAVVKEFGHSNNLPLYVPIDSLVDKGASASVAPSFKEMGRRAGKLAAAAMVGNAGNPEIVYPEKSLLTLNLTAAAQSGLQIPPDVVKKANRVVP